MYLHLPVASVACNVCSLAVRYTESNVYAVASFATLQPVEFQLALEVCCCEHRARSVGQPAEYMGAMEEKDIEQGPLLTPSKDESEEKPVAAADSRKLLGFPVHIVSGAAYCVASASMVLLNKAALSSFDFNSTTSLLFFQCLVCVVLVKVAELVGLVTIEPWNWKIIKASEVCS